MAIGAGGFVHCWYNSSDVSCAMNGFGREQSPYLVKTQYVALERLITTLRVLSKDMVLPCHNRLALPGGSKIERAREDLKQPWEG